ncbi:hypothetical protein DERP_013680 [Dermatophagoides pteronyssinus]|uniref:Uncharacterized protein n=1 Tax=Dermatophagoides pteronyssinus TaxID=6956 RepID=A0ABQ8JVR4_DERPT|nr:hypothetical protein DERP_013680 [Dermatophagoides pteronyssinus]
MATKIMALQDDDDDDDSSPDIDEPSEFKILLLSGIIIVVAGDFSIDFKLFRLFNFNIDVVVVDGVDFKGIV